MASDGGETAPAEGTSPDAGLDLTECEKGKANCDPHATCVDSPGSFTCVCQVGYSGDGTTCHPAPSISAGDTFACAVKLDGTLWCWGANDFGQLGDGTNDSKSVPHQVGTENDWRLVAAGHAHACAVKQDGSLWCWGNNNLGELGNGTFIGSNVPVPVNKAGTNTWVAVSAAMKHTCGIQADGSLWCWGDNVAGEVYPSIWGGRSATGLFEVARPVAGTTWQAVATEPESTCGLLSDGSAWCWGDTWTSTGGWGPDLQVPVKVAAPGSFTSLSGGFQTCALRTDSTIWCWRGPGLEPTSVGSDGWRSVSGGNSHNCGIKADGTLWCWGDNSRGELGNGQADAAIDDPPAQVGAATNWQSVAAGETFTCAFDSAQQLFCWGSDALGTLGDGAPDKLMPRPAAAPGPWTSVQTAHQLVAALHEGTASVWGMLASTYTSTTLTQVPLPTGGGSWTSVSVGVDQSSSSLCALDSSGNLYCGSPMGALTLDSSGWTDVTLGIRRCGLKSDKTLWCGSTPGALQQIGTDQWRDVSSSLEGGWSTVTCAIRIDGTLWCWGEAVNGAFTSSFVQKGTDTDWRQVSAGEGFTCATKTDDTLWCWGSTEAASISNSIAIGDASGTPTQIPGAWSSVSAGTNEVCGVQTDGSLWCWGFLSPVHDDNFEYAPTPSPLRIGTANDWTSIAAGSFYACGTRSDGNVWCFGDDSYGALGDNNGWRPTPMAVSFR